MILTITGVWGLGVGMNMGLYSLVVIQYMGLDLFPKVYGATCFIIAFVFISMGPFIGMSFFFLYFCVNFIHCTN